MPHDDVTPPSRPTADLLHSQLRDLRRALDSHSEKDDQHFKDLWSEMSKLRDTSGDTRQELAGIRAGQRMLIWLVPILISASTAVLAVVNR